MSNENLSKISEFGIWLIQWFGDFSKDIKVLQIRTLNSIIRFLVAPLRRKAKDGKILISKRNQDFLFSPACKKTTRIGAVRKSCRQAMLINESKLSFAKPA